MDASEFDWHNAPQLSLGRLLIATAIPSAIAYGGFHGALPLLVASGMPVVIAWPVVAIVMLLGLICVALGLLRHEANALSVSLWARMCLKPLTCRQWCAYLCVMVLGLLASLAVQPWNMVFMQAFSLSVPSYMPFFLNPTLNPQTVDAAVLSPGYPLHGSYVFLPLMAVTLVLNILAEELYFRAWMLPKLSRFGAWSWVVNGSLFALYHSFQIWLLPVLWVASLFFALVVYRSKSLWPSMAAHLVGNLLFTLLNLASVIAG